MTDVIFRRAATRFACALIASVAWFGVTNAGPRATADEPLQYNRDIRPILADHCFACHGLDSLSREADLRLDVRDAAIESGAVVPMNVDASEMIARVMTDDEDTLMPPPASKHPLSDEQREMLQRWIAEGAKYEKHWALVVPTKPEIPEVSDPSWTKNAIDHFVLRRLTLEGLSPAEESSPAALLRRLHLDITGLPPEPSDVSAFQKAYAADAEEAMSRTIDALMETDAWGEHRGRYWLDAARYADTHGMHFDNYREMWPYRDWVIRSFNDNQPFDQFTIEQLAGDLLENPTLEQQIATGFQRCNMTTNEGGTIEAENLAAYASDRVQTFGWVYLGLTTNCCQCHDHKFDPLTTKDYYSLAAFFRNTTQTGLDGNVKDGRGPVIRVPSEADRERWNAIGPEIAAAMSERDKQRVSAQSTFEDWLATTQPADIRRTIPTENPLVSLPLDEGSGNDVAIVSLSNEAIATSTGDLQWSVEGKFGPAVQLKPQGTIALGTAGDFARNQPFTHSEWIRTSKINQSVSPVARMDEASKHRGWDMYFSNGRLSVHLINSWPDSAIKVTTKAVVVKKDTWHHVAVTWDGSGKPEGISIYVDGVNQPTKVDTNTLAVEAEIRTDTPLRIGRRSRGNVFDGSVQDFRLYDRKLPKAAIDAIRQVELVSRALEVTAEQRSAAQRSELLDCYLSHFDPEYPELAAVVEVLQKEQNAIEMRSPLTHVQVERRDKPAMANILLRGQYDNVSDEVPAATPLALHPYSPDAPRNRLGLARWVVDAENPLTARVTINRFWQEIFGQGIVATPEDFGIMGAPPTHPELLDWLATDFVDSGWDVKRFFKQILMSATYRQAAVATEAKLATDRDNSLFSRGPRFRMDAEMVRDYALSVSGLRSMEMFGPGVRPYQPTDIWNMVGLPGGDTREYRQDSGDKLYRRSLYTFWKRMAPPPSLEAFGAPNREVCTVRRERTNTPLQALVTLNDPQYVEAARKLAERSMQSGSDSVSIANAIGLRALGRVFSARELEVVLSTHDDYLDHYAENLEDAAELIGVGDSPTDDSLDPQSLAAWTIVCNQIMNLDEALNK